MQKEMYLNVCFRDNLDCKGRLGSLACLVHQENKAMQDLLALKEILDLWGHLDCKEHLVIRDHQGQKDHLDSEETQDQLEKLAHQDCL